MRINPFVPNVPFLNLLKTLENRIVFWFFQRVEKGCIGNEWINKEEYLVIHFQSNEVDNPCVDWALSRTNLFLTKIIWCFLCFPDIFCYLERSPLWPSGSCLLGGCQLRSIDQNCLACWPSIFLIWIKGKASHTLRSGN